MEYEREELLANRRASVSYKIIGTLCTSVQAHEDKKNTFFLYHLSISQHHQLTFTKKQKHPIKILKPSMKYKKLEKTQENKRKHVIIFKTYSTHHSPYLMTYIAIRSANFIQIFEHDLKCQLKSSVCENFKKFLSIFRKINLGEGPCKVFISLRIK